MKFKEEHVYKQSAGRVLQMFVDPAAVQAKYKQLGSRNVQIRRNSRDGESWKLRIEREVAAEVPGPLAKFIKPWNKVVQEEHWQKQDGVTRGRIDVDIVGIPVAISTSLVLSPRGGGCVNEVETTVSSSLPVMGRPLVKFVSKDAKKYIEGEYRYISSHA